MRRILVAFAVPVLFALVGCAEFQRPAPAVGQTTTTSGTVCPGAQVQSPDGTCVDQDSNSYGEYDIP
jgi:hypothetical protein